MLAHALKRRVDSASRVEVTSRGGGKLIYETGMEPALLNIGDYTVRLTCTLRSHLLSPPLTSPSLTTCVVVSRE